MTQHSVSLTAHKADDLNEKFSAPTGQYYMTGIQALVRLPLMQAARDAKEGKNTAGFISGYRGSPLGALDQTLWKQKQLLASNRITFEPGLNEELAATMVWGSQQSALSPKSRYAGIFSMWYGKGPGVDRSMDVFKHANCAGTNPLGGVLAIAGDDHAARSSTLPHQSDHMFIAAMMPVLAPSSPQEFLDLGLHGFAMSRYCGTWVGFTAVADTVESGSLVDVDLWRTKIILPDEQDFPMPPDGVHLRWPDDKIAQEARLQEVKVYAALAYARKNHLNTFYTNPSNAKIGIVSAGKAWRDTLQALHDLGLDRGSLQNMGVRLLKLGMSWPVEPQIIKQFSEGLEEIVVVEQKRPIIEYLIKEQLYNTPEARRPKVVGKFDEKGEWEMPHGQWLLPAKYEITPTEIAIALGTRIYEKYPLESIATRLAYLQQKMQQLQNWSSSVIRAPHYCSGCPHNSSTKVPQDARAYAGIGCHYMATWIYPQTQLVSQMGGEGVAWLGTSSFTDEQHVFVNLGDGTYWHSGILAIRQALCTKANMTYKILYNDAVAMTGGQPIEGSPSADAIVWQLWAEGVKHIFVCAQEPERWQGIALPENTQVYEKQMLPSLQERCQNIKGISVIVYDQTCASEKRRRIKRKQLPPAPKKALINSAVCEGCSDCSTKSNCLSVTPIDTYWGKKRLIDQYSCNQDFSCVEGFCPSFVTLYDAKLSKKHLGSNAKQAAQALPSPSLVLPANRAWNMLIAGVGGTGVITVGQTLAQAAQLAGVCVLSLDQTGLAQKGGTVCSHLKFASQPDFLFAPRVADGECDVLLASDLPTATSKETVAKLHKDHTFVVANSHVQISSSFIKDPNTNFDEQQMLMALQQSTKECFSFNAQQAAIAFFDDEIAANFMIAGYAYQKGLLPIDVQYIERAIHLNGVSVDMNINAFHEGRIAAATKHWATPQTPIIDPVEKLSFEQHLQKQLQRAFDWGGASAQKSHERFYQKLQEQFSKHSLNPPEAFLLQILKERLRLACYKDEYEVARLHLQTLQPQIDNTFSSYQKMYFHFAPSFLQRFLKHPNGHIRKIAIHASIAQPLLKALSSLRSIRGTFLDPFHYFSDHQQESQDAPWFEAQVFESIAAPHSMKNLQSLCSCSALIKGFGYIKQNNRKSALEQWRARKTTS